MSSDRRLSPALIQWILAAALLLFGLVSLPAFAGFLFILAAILAAPIRPLRDLLSGVGVKSWMIGAAAVVLAIGGFVTFPTKPAADTEPDTRMAVTDDKAASGSTTAGTTAALSLVSTTTTTAPATTKAMTTTPAATTTTTAATTTTTPASTTTTTAATTTTTTAATTAKATTTTPAATTTTTKATRAYHAPSNSPNVIEVDGTNKCYRNEIVTCKFWGEPNTKYSIAVYYKSGVADADGLESKTSDSDGFVSWTWKIGGRTTPGTWHLDIKGGGETVRIEFDVLES